MPDVTNQLIPLLRGFAGQDLPVNAGRREPGYITLLWGLGGADAQRTPRTRRFLYSDRRHPMQAERWRNYQLHASIISLPNTRSDTNHVGEDQMYRCKLCAPKASRNWAALLRRIQYIHMCLVLFTMLWMHSLHIWMSQKKIDTVGTFFPYCKCVKKCMSMSINKLLLFCNTYWCYPRKREHMDLNWKVDWAAPLMLCSITYSMWGNFPRRLNNMLAYQKKDYYTEQYI
jgi:hypothetical protein